MKDEVLVHEILAGKEAAQEELFRRFSPRLRATVVHFIGAGDAEIEDLMQETFLIAFQKLKGFEFRSGLYLWVNHICVNLCLRRLRSRQRILLSQEEDLELLTRRAAMARFDQGKGREDRRRTVQDAVGRLGEPCAGILAARHLEDLSYAQVAMRLHLSLGTVMSRLARCREVLKSALSKEALT